MADNLLTILFYSGATHSFISTDQAKQLNLLISPLPFDLIVSTPTLKTMIKSVLIVILPSKIGNILLT